MKHLQTYEKNIFKNSHTLPLDKGKVKDAVKRKIKHFQDFFKNDDIIVDKEVEDQKELIDNIHLIFKKFSEMWNFCEIKYKKCTGTWLYFLEEYHDLIMKYGYKPTKITDALIRNIMRLEYSLRDAYSGWIDKNEDSKKLYHEISNLTVDIYKGYTELEDTMKKYNL